MRVAAADADAATGALAEHGFDSCELREHARDQTDVVIYVEAVDAGEAEDRGRSLVQALPVAALGPPLVCEHDEDVWREGWKRHFARTAIGRRFEVVPPWESPTPLEPGRITLIIHPGMAFGTGHHETTAGCLELLEDVVRPGDVVADVGCGSGILAIAAAKLGATLALAIDNDPEAVNAAHDNIVRNQVIDHVRVVLADGPPLADESGRAEGFDIVVANILAETLASMRERLTSCVKVGGAIVLSGIESSRRPLVEVEFGNASWEKLRTLERAGWSTLSLRRRA